jgi:nuclear transport factor 2 (NTF2) superfamily protein
MWAHNGGNRISVCFEYEYRDPQGQWFRAYGNENWEFDQQVRAAAPGERDASCWLALFRKQWQSGCVDGV